MRLLEFFAVRKNCSAREKSPSGKPALVMSSQGVTQENGTHGPISVMKCVSV